MVSFLVKTKEETLNTLYNRFNIGIQLNEELKPLTEAAFIITEANYKLWSNVNDTIIERLFTSSSVKQRFVESKQNMVYSDTHKKKIHNDIFKLQKKINDEVILLKVIIDELNNDLYEQVSNPIGTSTHNGTIELISTICRNFNNFAKSLETSPHGKAKVQSVKIQNEYDLQFYFEAILSLHFDNYLPEESTPSFGGTSSKIDFILKRDKVGIELKSDITKEELQKQINDDITKYKKHPDLINGTVIFFAHDPNKKVKYPGALEEDYEDIDHGPLNVKLIISQ